MNFDPGWHVLHDCDGCCASKKKLWMVCVWRVMEELNYYHHHHHRHHWHHHPRHHRKTCPFWSPIFLIIINIIINNNIIINIIIIIIILVIIEKRARFQLVPFAPFPRRCLCFWATGLCKDLTTLQLLAEEVWFWWILVAIWVGQGDLSPFNLTTRVT